MTDVASLSFQVDSSQATQANTTLDTMQQRARTAEGSFRDLHASTMQAAAGFQSFSANLGMGSMQLGQLSSSLQSVVTNLQAARGALDGMPASFANFDRARVQAEGLASALGTGAVTMEAFARQASQFNMTSLETSISLQRITSAIEGQTAAGRALRSMMQDYGVVLNGVTSSNADKVLMQFAERVRSFANTPANTQAMQRVLGPLGIDAISSIETPDYMPSVERANLLKARERDRQSAEAINRIEVDRKRIRTEQAQFDDLQGRFGLNQLYVPSDGGAALMRAVDGGRDLTRGADRTLGSAGETEAQRYQSEMGSTAGNLRILQYLSANPDSPFARERRGFWGRAADDLRASPFGQAVSGRDDPAYATFDADAQRNYDLATERARSGVGGWSDGLIGRNLAYARDTIGPRMRSFVERPVMPLGPTPPAMPPSQADLDKVPEGDATLLQDFGVSGPHERFATTLQLRGLAVGTDPNNPLAPGDVQSALRRSYNADGDTMFANLKDRLQHTRDTAQMPGTGALDQQATARWLQSVPQEQRGLARQMLQIAQQNGVSTSRWTSGAGMSFDSLLAGGSGAGNLTGPMLGAARQMQSGDDASFATTTTEQTNNSLLVQQKIRDAMEQGGAAVEVATAKWQAYYQVLHAGKGAAQANVAATAAETEALDRNRTAADRMMVSMRQQNDLDAHQAARMFGAGSDPSAREAAHLDGGIENDFIVAQRLNPSLSRADYSAQRYRAAGTAAVNSGGDMLAQQRLATNAQFDTTATAGTQTALTRQLNNELATQRDFTKEIVDAQRSGNADNIAAIRNQINEVNQLKAAYDALKQTATNLDIAANAKFEADFQERLNQITDPEERRKALAQKPLLQANIGNQEVNPPPGPRVQPWTVRPEGGFPDGSTPPGSPDGSTPTSFLPSNLRAKGSPYDADFVAAAAATGGRLSPQVIATLAYREGSFQADPATDGTGGLLHRGMMQFDAKTARANGLTVDGNTDERLVPHLAIPAAGRDLGKIMDGMHLPRGVTVTDPDLLDRILNTGGYGSSTTAQTRGFYSTAMMFPGVGGTMIDRNSPAAVTSASTELERGRAATQAGQNIQADEAASFQSRQTLARTRATLAGTGQEGADLAAAAVLGPEANAAEDAGRRISAVLDGVRSKLADQRMSLMDASTAAKGLAEAYTHGSAAGEQFQRNLANNQQIDNLKNLLNQPNLPAGVAASARGQIATLSANNGFNDSTASWTAGGQVAREQTNQTNQNRLLQSDINAGMFASDASLAAGRASVQADITLSSPTPPTNPNTGQTYTKEELTTAAAMNEQIRQTASTTAQARQGFEHMGDAAMKSFEDAVVGGARVKVMVHALAQDIERTLLQTFVENPLKKMFDSVTDSAGNAIEGYIGSLFGGGGGPTIVPGGGAALGAVLHRNFAQGGLLNQPTTFYANGGTVTGGEQDTEAIMPLKRLPNGNLGVAANGGGGNSIIVNSPITIQGGGGGKGGGMDPATMKLLQAQMENMHTAAVRNVLAQQQRDGGDLSSMGKAWS